MSDIKLANITELENTLTDIADAIRERTGKEENIAFNNMAEEINSIGEILDWDKVATHAHGGDVVLLTTTSIAGNVFNAWPNITSFSAPELTSIGGSCIYGNTKLTSLYLPKLQTMGGYGLARNTNAELTGINLPSLTTSQTYMFEWMYSKLDFTALTNLMTNSLRGWRGNILVIRKSNSICECSAINAFYGNVFSSSGAGGTLYVPQSLIDDYKNATNWSTILEYANNMILPIEGSPYETHYTDDTEVNNATESSSIYAMSGWGITGANGEVPYIAKGTTRGTLINLKGDYPIHLNSTTGKLTAVYPIPIPTGKTGVTITSDSMDVSIIECSYDGTNWIRTTSSGWQLMSDSTSHTYNFTDSTTTHIWAVLREAGEDSGTVTDAMCDTLQLAWI